MLNDNCYTIVKLYSFICGIMEIIRNVFWCMNFTYKELFILQILELKRIQKKIPSKKLTIKVMFEGKVIKREGNCF